MPSVTYFLKEVTNKKVKTGESLIMVTFTFNYTRIRLSTGEKIKNKYWIQGRKGKKSRAINGWEFKGDELNFRLKKIDEFLFGEYRKELNDGVIPSKKSITEAFMVFLNKKSGDRIDLHKFIQIFLDRYKKKYNWRTYGRYVLLQTRILEFEKKIGHRVDFDTIGKKFYNDFTEYCQGGVPRTKKGKTKEKLKDVSIGNMIKCLKKVLNEAVEDGFTENMEHRKKYFKVFDEDSDSVFLTVDEIERIYKTPIEDDYLRFKRDIFVLSCYTGLRYSDWHNYSVKSIIENGKFLRVMTFKTSELVVIPLSSIAKEILERYQEMKFTLPSNVKMNKTLKEIGQLAEMHQTMNVSSTSGGIVMTVSRMKWELITTHTARRSFATNAFLSGIPTISIMKITGHKTERSFLKYIRIDKLQNAIKLAEHPFFK